MKVLFVINSSNNGGAQKMIVTLYKGMINFFPESKIVFLEKKDSQYSNIKEAYYLSDKLSSHIDYMNVYKKLKKVIKTECPDAIISFLPLANILSSVIGKKVGVKVRIASQRNPPQIYGTVVRILDRFLGSKGYYTHNVCNSQAGMDAFENYSDSYKKHLSVIMNCVEPADFSITKEEARKRLGIPIDKKIITCVGRLHEQKNHKLLVDTMKRVNDAILYCGGDGPLRKEISSQILQNKVSKKIVLLGDLERTEVRLLLRASDIFVIPSKYEGLSNSLIEAMSYGLPIIFSNIPSFTKFLKLDGGLYAGVLIDNNNDEIWAKEIEKLIHNPDLIDHYKNLSLSKVADLTAEKMSLKFKSLIKKIIK
jgi:glycosyltransferase involved in cell wall biosynthesis